jgi:hypothetical protein
VPKSGLHRRNKSVQRNKSKELAVSQRFPKTAAPPAAISREHKLKPEVLRKIPMKRQLAFQHCRFIARECAFQYVIPATRSGRRDGCA